MRLLEDLADPRQRIGVVAPLDEILPPGLVAVPAGAETITDGGTDVDFFVAEWKAVGLEHHDRPQRDRRWRPARMRPL